MLTRFIKIQLVLFTLLTIIAVVVLGWYYLKLPSVAGIGTYDLHAKLPRSGGLYSTANVTYRGTQIGKVTAVNPTETGAEATLRIDNRYKIPIDSVPNVHSVSAIGEQYLDLVSTGNQGQYYQNGQTITALGSQITRRPRSRAAGACASPAWASSGSCPPRRRA